VTGGPGSVSDRGEVRADRVGPAPGGKWTATRVRAGPRGSEEVRIVRSRSGIPKIGIRGR
jgi:hypothetical protein